MTREKPHRPRKRFGQNFLQDQMVIHKIVEAISPQPDDRLIEIGPGLGALTRALLPMVKKLEVVELDRDLAEALPKRLGNPNNLVVHQADALDFDFQGLNNRSRQNNFKIVGNLPYNVATPLILRLVETLPEAERLIFMIQDEVADRLTAQPGTKDYGRLTIMVQYFYQFEKLFEVPPQAFYPIPKVMSAVIACTPRYPLPFVAKDFAMFAQLVKQAFSQRRKTIANTLKKIVSIEQLQAAGIDPVLRPEQITLEAFIRLSNLVPSEHFS